MPPSDDILAWALGVIAAATTIYTLALAVRFARALRHTPRLVDPPTTPRTDAPSLCVMCAARDEQATIGAFARSVLAQTYTNLRLMVVLDRCTDDTESALRTAATTPDGAPDPRLEVLHNTESPGAFNAKAHALDRALQRAESPRTAELLLITDADARLQPTCLAAAVATLESLDADALSLFASMPCSRWWDLTLQPVFMLEFLRRYPLDRVNDDRRMDLALANGPFTLVRRDAYAAAGGHRDIPDNLLEDATLGRRLRSTGKRLRVLPSRALLRIERDLTWPEYRRRWVRNLSGITAHPAARATRLFLTGTLFPLACTGAGALGVARLAEGLPGAAVLLGVAVLSLLVIGATLIPAYRVQDRPTLAILLYPFGAALGAAIMVRATTAGVSSWARDALQDSPS